MKLYFVPGACSLSPHIVLREVGVPFELDLVDGRAKKTQAGGDYRAVNPKGQVPALQLDDGAVLTEGSAIVQYLADRKPEKHLAPPSGTMERYRLQEWLNYVATEIHKGLSPMFNPSLPDPAKALFKELMGAKLAWLAKQLDGRSYLMGDQFTVADAYLFTVLRWTPLFQIDVAQWPSIAAFVQRVGDRPAVRAALEAEAAAKAEATARAQAK